MNYLRKADAAQGSLEQVASERGVRLEQAFANARLVVVIDQSGSMASMDSRDGRERFEVAETELRRIQELYPGAVAVFEFSDTIRFCPDGVPTRMGKGTDMAGALRFVRDLDTLYDIVVISDGEPDNERMAMSIARTFKGPVNTIYIGPAGGDGERFLRELAHATGGREYRGDKPGELMPGVIALLGGGSQ